MKETEKRAIVPFIILAHPGEAAKCAAAAKQMIPRLEKGGRQVIVFMSGEMEWEAPALSLTSDGVVRIAGPSFSAQIGAAVGTIKQGYSVKFHPALIHIHPDGRASDGADFGGGSFSEFEVYILTPWRNLLKVWWLCRKERRCLRGRFTIAARDEWTFRIIPV